VTSLCTSVFTQGTEADQAVAHEQVPLWPLRRAVLSGGFRRISNVRRRKSWGSFRPVCLGLRATAHALEAYKPQLTKWQQMSWRLDLGRSLKTRCF